MSCSWVDPHFAALYARREEERLAERLVTRMREQAAPESHLEALHRVGPGWAEREAALRSGHPRLL